MIRLPVYNIVYQPMPKPSWHGLRFTFSISYYQHPDELWFYDRNQLDAFLTEMHADGITPAQQMEVLAKWQETNSNTAIHLRNRGLTLPLDRELFTKPKQAKPRVINSLRPKVKLAIAKR